jgi:hypothetical protein
MRTSALLLVVPLAAPVVLQRRAVADTTTVSARAPSTRERLPLTVSAAASIFALGIDASYQLSDRVAVGAQVASAAVHNDVSLRSRYFLVARPAWGLYVGAAAHFMPYSPLFFRSVAAGGTFEVGYELRTSGGFTLGVGAGLGAYHGDCACASESSDVRWVAPLPAANLRIGKSW